MSWGIDLIDEHGTHAIVDGHTYNLTPMWRLAGVVNEVTRELDGIPARELHKRAVAGLTEAVSFPDSFRALNPENGWGDYDGFIQILTRTAIMTAEHPHAKVAWSG